MRLLKTVLLAAAVALSGCSGEEATPCADNTACAEGQACIDEVCTDVTCLTSADCDIQQYCTGDFECASGCDQDADCFAGQACNTDANTCEAYGCRDTQLDCNYGERCDVTTGSCYVAEQMCTNNCDYFSPSCPSNQSCAVSSLFGTCDAASGGGCPSGSPCAIVEVDEGSNCGDFIGLPDDSECPSGWYCDYLDGYTNPKCHRDQCVESFCSPTCTTPDDCPRGFDCIADSAGRGVCSADCEFLNENGWL